MKRSIGMLAAIPLLVLAGSAQADSIKFFSGTNEGAATAVPFTIAPGTVYQAIRLNNTACPGGGPGNCSGNPDVRATTVTFAGGISASNTGPAGTGVIVDLQPDFAGLGVGPLSGIPSDADQIAPGDTLTIHFPTAVVLNGVSTLFDTGHTPFGTGFEINTNVLGANTFQINGMTESFLAANLATLSLIGQDFTFSAIRGQPQFYISGLEFSAVPLPGAVWLFGSGLVGLFAMSRKKRKVMGVAV